MPTSKGYPTVDEERSMRDRAKTLHKNEDAPVDALPMTVTFSLGEWRKVLDGDHDARQRLAKLLTAHIEMANRLL